MTYPSNLEIRLICEADQSDTVDLFKRVFADAQGADAGEALERLVTQLIEQSETDKVVGFGAFENSAIVGSIYFSQLAFDDPRRVMMLSPVAVRTEKQRSGVGQALIREGLSQLKAQGVDLVVTYGDPAYYGKFGFIPLSEELIQAPHPLTMPQGWLGAPLSSQYLPRLNGKPTCVNAFNDDSLW